MTNSKLSKLYLVTPESFNKLNNATVKKILNRKDKNTKKDIDFLHILKNLQRQRVKPETTVNKKESDKLKDMESILTGLVSKLKRNKEISDKSISTQSQTKDFGMQTIKSPIRKKISTQTNHSDKVDQKTQTDWHEGEVIEELANKFNKSFSFMDTHNENQQLLSADNEVGELDVDDILQTSHDKKPFSFTGIKQLKLPKRSASPLVHKLRKVKINNEGRIDPSSYTKPPLTQPETKRQKRIKMLRDMKNSKITGSRKAKQSAMVKMQELLNWKRI